MLNLFCDGLAILPLVGSSSWQREASILLLFFALSLGRFDFIVFSWLTYLLFFQVLKVLLI